MKFVHNVDATINLKYVLSLWLRLKTAMFVMQILCVAQSHTCKGNLIADVVEEKLCKCINSINISDPSNFGSLQLPCLQF